ncbi:MAG: 4Fe-4S dicluster domain-containing protein [Deltaproteobacteria bacterium]|nr:4Fe-4S dicluster domain-containing protein [Deltaproteobacteria bacterium]
MGVKAMIQDNTRCIGCRACMVACKEWNDLPADDTTFFSGAGYQNPKDLDDKNYTLITYSENVEHGEWVFGRQLCMHCTEPACVSACPTGALSKNELGSVDFTEWRCIGCRYCMQACPFLIPKFDYDSLFPKIHKCTFCADRVAADLTPACAQVCPTHAISFGERDEMLAEAKRRIASAPGSYVPEIYGADEVGGTNVFHLSAVPFADVGYETGLPKTPLPDLTDQTLRFVPRIFVTLVAFFSLVTWVVRRRMKRLGIEDDH